MTDDLDGLVRLERSQIKPAAEVLARAFYDDPLFTYYFPVNLISGVLHVLLLLII